MEIQQSSLYARYLDSLGWDVLKFDGFYFYAKRFPFIGVLVKIQRINKLPSLPKLVSFLKQNNARLVAVEPDANIANSKFKQWLGKLARYFKINRQPFLATKTVRIDLAASAEIIFKRFVETKRRAVRRALKNRLAVRPSKDIDLFIKLKNKSAGLFGFITTYGIKKLWQAFAPQGASILLAYAEEKDFPIAGVLLFYCDKVAYYWLAGATKEGKKLFAPTLLVWEALKQSKRHGCRWFDVVGVWDERLPEKNQEWKGFTKFKEGFGGTFLYYPLIDRFRHSSR